MRFFLLTVVFSFSLSAAFASRSSISRPRADSLEAYVGTYKFKDGSPISAYKITAKDGTLYGEADSYGANKLNKQPAADTFQSTSSYGSIITFRRDAAEKVVGLKMAIQGTDLEADRQ